MWPSEDFFAVCIEPGAPQLHTRHQLLRAFEFSLLAEHGINKFLSGLFSHGYSRRALSNRASLASLNRLGGSPHVLLAMLEEALHAIPQAVTGLEEFIDEDKILPSLNAIVLHDFPSTLALAAQLNEKQPQLTGLFGDLGVCSVSKDSPVVNPLA